MDGLELLKQINREFKIPVVIMSCNVEETVILKALEQGALSYIPKPVKQEDLNDIWKFVEAVAEKRKLVVTEEEQVRNNKINNSNKGTKLGSTKANQGSSKYRKNQGGKCERKDQDKDNLFVTKKPKFRWSEELHEKFVSAVNHLGLEEAVPKEILKHMKIEGLTITRQNISSHLQKYRQYQRQLRRELMSSYVLSQKLRRSSFKTGYSPSPGNNCLTLGVPSNVQGPSMFGNTPCGFKFSNELNNGSRATQQYQQPNQGTNFYTGMSLNSSCCGSLDNGTAAPLSSGIFGWPSQGEAFSGVGNCFSTPGDFTSFNGFGTLNPLSTTSIAANQESAALSQLPANNFNSITRGGDGSFVDLLINGSDTDNFSDNHQEIRESDLSELLGEYGLNELLGSTNPISTIEQQQGVQEANSYDVTGNELFNAEFSSSCAIIDKGKVPSFESSSDELQGMEEIMKFLSDSILDPMDEFYYPSFDQQQSNITGDGGPSSFKFNNASSKDQVIEDYFDIWSFGMNHSNE